MPTGTLNQRGVPQHKALKVPKGVLQLRNKSFHAMRWFQRQRKKNLGVVPVFSSPYIGRLKTSLYVVWPEEPSWVRPLRGYILVKKLMLNFDLKAPDLV
jgi:hypothetical protein